MNSCCLQLGTMYGDYVCNESALFCFLVKYSFKNNDLKNHPNLSSSSPLSPLLSLTPSISLK